MSQSLANDPTTAIRDATRRIEPALIEIRRDIHAHPELGFEEVRTAGVVARELTVSASATGPASAAPGSSA